MKLIVICDDGGDDDVRKCRVCCSYVRPLYHPQRNDDDGGDDDGNAPSV